MVLSRLVLLEVSRYLCTLGTDQTISGALDLMEVYKCTSTSGIILVK